MNYEGQICRSPMERSSFMLPTAVGCSYNRCRFCTLFKHLNYRELPMNQIESELCRVRDLGGNPKTVFFGDGNAFGQDTGRLINIIDRVHFYFPACVSINMDATVTNIRLKSDSELHELFEAGVRHLYLGIESGLDDVLAFMKKDHSLSEALAQIERLHRAGFIYDAHIMTGVAGKGRGTENALALADFFNQTHPSRIINFSLFLHERAPLFCSIQDHTFLPADELENLQEEKTLLEHLDCGPVSYDGFHDFVEFRIRGTLPDHRQKMLSNLERAISDTEKKWKETGVPVFALVR